MSGHPTTEYLQQALRGELAADQESALHEHIEFCPACSAELEQIAGADQIAREIPQLLHVDEIGDVVPGRDDCSATDFVVEHLEASDSSESLGRLGGYEILEVIGRGGMGVVLKGYDCELKRFVAVKALAPHLAHSPLARKRFAREAQAAAAVVNSHVIAIHQVQPNGRLPFLVMPLLTGESLAQRLQTRGSLELKEALRIGMQAAEGLAAAHEQGLVHRDVKPANILLEKGVERAVLTDFGLARTADDVSLTRMGVIAGTPEYMSPEQARGEAVDARSDLFSLGCVLYEMATGVSPFRTETPMATLRRIVDEPPRSLASRNPELPRWFVLIVERMLEKEPARRFGSAAEVSALLAGCLAHLQQPATVVLPEAARLLERNDRSSKPMPTSSRSWRGWFAGGVSALLLLVGGGWLAGWVAISEKDAKQQSEKNLARISAALEAYRQAHDDRFPPSAIAGRDGGGGPLHSWRVAILPYLGYQKLHDAYRFDEAWDSAHNKALLSQLPDLFRAPFDDSTNASYFGVTLSGRSQPQAISLSEPAPTGGSSPPSEPPPSELSDFVTSVLREKPSEKTLNINFFDAAKVIRHADRPWLQDLIAVAEKSGRVARDQGKPWVTAELLLHQAKARVAELDRNPDEQLKQLQIVRVLFDLLAQQAKNGEFVFLTKEATELLLRPRLAEVYTRIATLRNDLREQTRRLEDWVAVQGELVKKARDAQVDPLLAERERQQVQRWIAAARAAKDQLFEGRTVLSESPGTLYGGIGDGAANTIAIVEAKRDIPWTKPEDIVFDPRSDALQLGGWYRSGWFAAFADASVRWFPNETNHAEVRNLLTILDRDGGSGKAPPGVTTDPLPDPNSRRVFVGNPIEVTGTTQGHVWGSDIYTGDSNLDAAAVHAGVIAVGETRKIYIEVVDAPTSFAGSTRNGVTSMKYGNYPTAIKLHQTRPPVETLTRSTLTFDRSSSLPGGSDNAAGATRAATSIGELTVLYITGAKDGTVWGTHIYTADSDIAAAAVHAGLMAVGEKRVIAVEVVLAPKSYAGTTRNGVTSLPYDHYPTAIRLHDISLTPRSADLPPLEAPPQRWDDEDLGRLAERLEDRPGVCSVAELTGSERGNVWGADVYTGDSSLAAAAVHAGLLKVGETGWICREVVPTQKRYLGTTRNGVTSLPFDEYPIAIKLRRVTGPAPAHRLQDYQPLQANDRIRPPPSSYLPGYLGPVSTFSPDKPGTRVVVELRGSTTGAVWGADVYTADSDMATAAVHAGLLKSGEVGWISREVAPAQKFYRGSTRNGVTSLDYGEYPTAIKLARFDPPVQKSVLPNTPSSPDPQTRTERTLETSIFAFDNQVGSRVLIKVKGHRGGNVWGSDVYTGDSDLGTAAVHTGLLKVGEFGWVIRDVVPPPSRFEGTTRNGIDSRSFDSYPIAIKLTGSAGPALRHPVPDAPHSPISFADFIGTRVAVRVTGSTEGGVWGHDLYTADSNLAAAAVHAGLIKVGEPQWILRETVLPPKYFAGTSRNGVRSLSFENYSVAMKLSRFEPPGEVAKTTGSLTTPDSARPVYAVNLEGSDADMAVVGSRFKTQIFLVVTGSDLGTIWGTDTYTADSPFAVAAVHAGLLKVGETGWIICESVPTQGPFEGSTRHGLSSQSHNRYDVAYRLRRYEPPIRAQSQALPERTTLPVSSKTATVQLRIAAPAAMKVEVAELDAPFDPAGKLAAPARLKLLTGKTYRLKLTEITGRPGLELHPQIELLDAAEPLRAAGISLEAVPIEFTDEDFDVSQRNQPTFKLVTLKKSTDGTPSSVESKLHTRLEEIEQARQSGAIPLCIIRLRHHDATPREQRY